MREKISKGFLRDTLTQHSKQFIISLALRQINPGISKNAYIWPPESIAVKCWRDCQNVYPETPGSLLRDQDVYYTTLANKARRKMHRSPCKCPVQWTFEPHAQTYTGECSRSFLRAGMRNWYWSVKGSQPQQIHKTLQYKKVPLERNVPLDARKIWQIVISTLVTSPQSEFNNPIWPTRFIYTEYILNSEKQELYRNVLLYSPLYHDKFKL